MFKRILLVVLGILVVGIIVAHLAASPAPDHPFFDQFSADQYPLVIAHAGSELYPTDTMYALEKYAAMGVDILEMDVHMTADGEIVLIHDDTLDRTTDGTGDVRQMTLAEIQAYDAGYYWTKDDQTYPFRGMGITVPTLRQVFETFPEFAMIIEIKQDTPSMAAPLCDLIRQYNMQVEDEVRDFVIRGFLLMAGTITPQYQALQVPESRDGIPIVTRLFLWFAHNRNVQVHIWTINEAEDMQRFIDKGLDGIMTDRTDTLLEILGR
ncbi:MAG: glycerophosphodiester phosphodiesterase [Anaerolineales bacterium]